MSRWARVRRWFCRVGLAMAVLVLTLAMALAVLTGTEPGRGWVLGQVLPRVNDNIPGRVEVRELSRLGLSGLGLAGLRVFDPDGQQVADLSRLEVDIAAFELIDGRIVVPRVELDTGSVDLRELGDPRKGLVAAFVDPDAPASPPSDGPPPYVHVPVVRVRSLEIRAPAVEQLGELVVRDLELNASFELDQSPRAELEHLALRIERGGEELGRVNALSATLARGTAPSSVELMAELLGMRLSATAEMVLPPEPSWQTKPLTAAVTLEHVSSAALARLLRDEGQKGIFEGELGLEVHARGSVAALDVKGEVSATAGSVEFDARFDELKRVRLSLQTKELALAALQKGLPEHRASGKLAASADFGDSEHIPLTLALRDGALDATSLPSVDASGVLEPKRITGAQVKMTDDKSRVEVTGHVGFDGSGAVHLGLEVAPETLNKWAKFTGSELRPHAHLRADLDAEVQADRRLTVRGTLAGRQLRLADNKVERVDARVELSGQATHPTGHVDLSVQGARIGVHAVPRLKLNVRGGPERYRVKLDGDFTQFTSQADLFVGRNESSVDLRGHLNGTLQGRDWRMQLEPTVVGFEGSVETKGVEVSMSGQRVQARGRVTRRTSELEFSANELELSALDPLLSLPDPLHGTVNVRGRFSGSPETPNLDVRLEGVGLALGARPALDLNVETRLDTQKGTLDAHLAVSANKRVDGKQPLQIALDLAHRFDSQVPWQTALEEGSLDAKLLLTRVDSHLVAKWAEVDELPAQGVLEGNIVARGTRARPTLAAQLRSDATVLGAALSVDTSVELGAGGLRAQVAVDDQVGRWLDLDAALDLGEGALDELMRHLPKALSERAWEFKLDAKERGVDTLPGAQLAKLQGMATGALLVLNHEPGQEPEGRLLVTARQVGQIVAQQGQDCPFVRPRVELDATLARGQLRAALSAALGRQRLLDSEFSVPLQLRPALAGGELELGPIAGALDATSLDLATLPLMCGVLRGTLTGHVAVDDPLGKRPTVDAKLRASEFSFGGRTTLDVAIDARLDHRAAQADVALVASGKRSTLEATLPIDLSEGHLKVQEDAALKAVLVLNALPIAPFLDPSGAVSYASGTVDGRVEASGQLRQPTFRGRVDLRDIAFTATSLAQPLREVKGTLQLEDKKLTVTDFEAHDREGVLRIGGDVDLSDRKRIEIALDIEAKEFPLRQQGQVVATADLAADVKTTIRPKQTLVTIDLGDVDMWLESTDFRSGIALQQHSDFVIDGVAAPDPNQSEVEDDKPSNTAPAPETAKRNARKTSNQRDVTKRSAAETSNKQKADAESLPSTRLKLLARDGIWVKRDDFAVNLSADLNAAVGEDSTRVQGQVLIKRGYVQLMGKVFDVEKGGTLEFIGSKQPDPVVNLTVAHDNRRSGQRITLVITGRSSAPILTFRVDEQVVTAGKAFEAMYGSQQSNERPNAAQDQAKGFVGGMTAGLMATTARRELGAAAPIIMIEPGEQTGEGRVRAGFDFDFLVPSFLRDVVTGVYFEGIADKNSEGAVEGQSDGRVQAAVLLELYFPKNFFSAGQYGPGSTWSVDVGWQL